MGFLLAVVEMGWRLQGCLSIYPLQEENKSGINAIYRVEKAIPV